jgi:hypothetical protein
MMAWWLVENVNMMFLWDDSGKILLDSGQERDGFLKRGNLAMSNPEGPGDPRGTPNRQVTAVQRSSLVTCAPILAGGSPTIGDWDEGTAK